MNWPKKAIAGVMIVGATLVAGCSTGEKVSTGDGFGPGARLINVTLPDGRKMECVTFADKGISCDWANAKRV